MKKFLKDNWFLILIIVYVLFPLDLIPDAIPVFGNIDEGMVLLIELIRRLRGRPPQPVNEIEKRVIKD